MPQEGTDVLGRIMEMLSTEEGQQGIKGLIGGLTGGSANSTNNDSGGESSISDLFTDSDMGGIGGGLSSISSLLGGNINMADIVKVMGRIGEVSKHDPGINLLKALQPFMRDEKSRKVDDAVKLLMLSKIPGMLKEIGEGGESVV